MNQIKNIIAIATLSFSLCNQALANSDTPRVEDPVKVSIIDKHQSQPTVSMHFNEVSAGLEYNITIADQHGYEFYNSTVMSQQTDLKFLLTEEVLDQNFVIIAITEKKSGKKIVYKLNNQVQVTQTTALVRM